MLADQKHTHFITGDCRWTYQQNQAVIAALKKENKELKAVLVQLPASNTSGKVWSTCMYCFTPALAAFQEQSASCRLLLRQSCVDSTCKPTAYASSMTSWYRTG